MAKGSFFSGRLQMSPQLLILTFETLGSLNGFIKWSDPDMPDHERKPPFKVKMVKVVLEPK